MSGINPFKGKLWIVGVLLALAAYSIGLAVGPRVSGDALSAKSAWGVNCLTAIDLPGPFGLLLNCDSPDFMESASKPERLVEKGNWRQNRPGQIWLAWLVSQPLKAMTDAFVSFASRADVQLPEGNKRSRAQAIADLAPGFVAYYLLNLLLLVATIAVLRSNASLVGLNPTVFTLVASVLLFNDITKAYLLTPHSQLMNVFLPTLLVTLVFRGLRQVQFTRDQLLTLAAVSGLGLLVYATWALVPVVMALWMASGLLQNSRRAAVLPALRWSPVLALLIFAPYVCWYAYVVQRTGLFYVHETSYDGGLVWLLRLGAMEAANRFVGNIAYLLGAAAAQSFPYIAMSLPAVLVLTIRRRSNGADDNGALKQAFVAAALIGLLYLIFFALLGFRLWRYAVPLLPALALPIAMINCRAVQGFVSNTAKTRYLWLLACIGAGIALFEVTKEGPWG